MLTKYAAMTVLVDACPSFKPIYASYVAENYGPDDEPLPYVEVGELTRHLQTLLEAGAETEIVTLFEAVERLHVEGDDYVQEFATIGFLESIQNTSPNPTAFERFLQPKTKEWWSRLNRFWGGDPTALRAP